MSDRSHTDPTCATGARAPYMVRASAGVLPSSWWPGWLIGHRVKLPVPHVHALHFLFVKRPRSAPVEDRQLVAALVNRTIAIDSLRDRQRRTARPIRRDQLGR